MEFMVCFNRSPWKVCLKFVVLSSFFCAMASIPDIGSSNKILSENIIGGLSLFSPPVRAMVPMLYTIRRIFVDIDWIHDVWLNKTLPVNASFQDMAWHIFGKFLAVANLVYFSINLFVFLVPCFLPRAFERYFEDKGEIFAKSAENKRSMVHNKSQFPEKKTD